MNLSVIDIDQRQCVKNNVNIILGFYMRFLYVLVLLFGVLVQANSAPKIVVTSSKNEGHGTRYFYSVTGWSTSDRTPSVCGDANFGGNLCVINEVVWFDSQPSSYVTLRQWRVPVTPGDTLSMGELLRNFNNQGAFIMPYNTSVLIEGFPFNATCISLEVITNIDYWFVFASCGPVKAPPVKCDFYGKNTIDYGTLIESALNGARASTNLTLSCSGSASVSVKATRTNSYGVRLRDDDSLYSEIKVNDKDATNGINVSVSSGGDASINVASTLKVRGDVTPGKFSGFTVITVSPN